MIPETTLSAPLTDHLYAPFISQLTSPLPASKFLPPEALPRRLADSFRQTQIKDTSIPIPVPHTSRLTGHLISIGRHLTDPVEASKILCLSLEDIRIMVRALANGFNTLKGNSQGPIPSFDDINLDDPPISVVRSYQDAMYWLSIVQVVVQSKSSRRWTQGHSCWTHRLLTMIEFDGKWYLLSNDAVLLMKDLSFSTFLTHWYCFVDKSKARTGQHFTQFQSWAFRMTYHLGESAYSLIKGVETLCKLRLIQLSETTLDPDDQIRPMLAKYQHRQMTLGLPDIDPGIHELWAMIQQENCPVHVAEIFSFLKLAGHPYVDAIGGADSASSIAHIHSDKSPMALKQLEWSFCHLYTRGYILKMGTWPKMEFNLPHGKKSILKGLRDSNHPSLPLGLGLYEMSDWEYVTFLPHVQFDYGEDILSLITDKALSYKRSEIDNSWYGRLPFTPKRPTSSNRVLEELLRRPTFSMRDVCDRVSRRDIPFDWKVITICPKEREMKDDTPRMFAIMNLEPRSLFVLTEQNLAKNIFKFIPEQTMTMSSTGLTTHLLKLNQDQHHNGGVTLKLEFDFERWNLKFDKTSVNPIGCRIDQIFGTDRLYDFVHEFFEDCLWVLRHASYTPDIKHPSKGIIADQPGIANGHPAGMEGIWQKGWTLITISILSAALWQFGLTYNIVGQGDNQVVFVRVPKLRDEDQLTFIDRVRALSVRLLQAVSTFAGKIGHTIKPEECFQSTTFMSYGKQLIFRGYPLPTTIKSISRMIPSTTPDNPSCFQMLSNISAVGVASTARAGNTFPIFVFCKLIENWFIRREIRGSVLHGDLFKKALPGVLAQAQVPGFHLLLTLIPPNLGGLPVSGLAEYLYRGHPDPLASSLASIRLFSSLPYIRNYLALLDSGSVLDSGTAIDPTGLIMDPYSIPLLRVSPPGSAVSARVRDTLIKITKNRDIVDLVKRDSLSRDQFVKDILDMSPFYPKVAHDIYKSSIFGVCDAFAKRFTNTRTLFAISRKSDMDLSGLSLSLDKDHFLSTVSCLAMVYKVKPPTRDFNRPLEMHRLAAKCRLKWGVEKPVGISNVHPLDLGHILSLPTDSDVIETMIHQKIPIITAMCLTSHSDICSASRGTVEPYLGNPTSDKSVAKWTRPVDTSPPQQDAIRLLQIRHLIAQFGSVMYEFLTACAQSRCSYNAEALTLFLREKLGGVLAHRYQMSDDSGGSFLSSLATWATHVTLSSNLSGLLGELDHPVSYQEVYETLISLSQWWFKDRSIPAPFGLALVVPLISEVPVIEDYIVDKTKMYLRTIPQSPRLFYATSMRVLVSSRTETTGRSQEALSEFTEVQPTPAQALVSIFLSALTGRHRMIRRGVMIRSEISRARLVDLPECSLILFNDYLDALATAILVYISSRYIVSLHKDHDINQHLQSLLVEASQIIIPIALSTLQECRDIPSEWGRQTLGGYNREVLIRWWSYRTILRSLELLRGGETHTLVAFSEGKRTLSASLTSSLFFGTLVAYRRDFKCLRSAKLLCRTITDICKGKEEVLITARLWEILRLANLLSFIRVGFTSPEFVLRKLRGTLGALPLRADATYSALQSPLPSRDACIGTDLVLQIETKRPNLTPEESLTSLELRRWQSMSDAPYRWAPIHQYLRPEDNILIIGIGAGGILRCIPSECKVVGLDLCQPLECLGQGSTTYIPPYFHPHFELHPISWTLGGNILNPTVRERILSQVRDKEFTVVLIDCEEVPTYERLIFRQMCATAGGRCWARVPVLPTEKEDILRSICAYSVVGDASWDIEIGMGQELVVGSGPSPLGLKVATCSDLHHQHNLPLLRARHIPTSEKSKNESKVMSYVILTGRMPDLLDRIHLDLTVLSPPMYTDEHEWRDFVDSVVYGAPARSMKSLTKRVIKAALNFC